MSMCSGCSSTKTTASGDTTTTSIENGTASTESSTGSIPNMQNRPDGQNSYGNYSASPLNSGNRIYARDSDSYSGVSSEKHDALESELEEIASDVGDMNRKVQNLRDDLDEIAHHHGDVDSAEMDAETIVRESQDAIDRVETLVSDAEEAGDGDIAAKARTMETSLSELHISMSTLHDNLETAQSDTRYRHQEGIGEMSENMDDVETKAQEAEEESN